MGYFFAAPEFLELHNRLRFPPDA